MRFILSILSLSLINLIFGQQGLFPYQVYGPNDYNGSSQNWAAAQDSKGRMYFANTGVLLKFNGTDWEQINIGNTSLTTAVDIDKNDNIYVGGYKELGQLLPTRSGKLKFKSFLNDSLRNTINRIWKIKISPDSGVYFIANEGVFRYYEDSLYVIRPDSNRFVSLCEVEGRIFTNGPQGLHEIKGHQIDATRNGTNFKNLPVWGIQPYDQLHYLMLTRTHGISKLDKVTFEYTTFNPLLNERIKDLRAYDLVQLSEEEYAVVTNLAGIIIFNRSGQITKEYNANTGASDDIGINTFMGKDQILWFLGNNGISRILHNFSLDYINEIQGLKPPVYSLNEVDGKLIAHTATGVQIFNDDHFEFWIPDRGQSWLGEYDEELDIYFALVGSSLRAIKDSKVIFFDNGDTDYTFLKSKLKTRTIYKQYANYLEVLSYNNKIFKIEQKYNTKLLFRQVVEVAEDSLLFYTEDEKVGLMILKNNDFDVELFDQKHGINVEYRSRLMALKNEGLYIIQNDSNYFNYNQKERKLEPFDFKATFDIIQEDITDALEGPKNQFAFTTSDGKLIWVQRLHNGTHIVDSNSFNLFGANNSLNGLYFKNNGELLVTSSQRIFRYNPHSYWNLQKAWDIELTSIQLNKDSNLFNGYFYYINDKEEVEFSNSQHADQIPNLSYIYNNLKFKYNGLDYNDPRKTTYSYKLENFDDQWSEWTKQNEKEYTNLFEGSYTFKVKAKNVFGRESEVSTYEFVIKPPIYRTIWAYLFYTIFIIGIIVAIIRINERRLKKENERLEQIVLERTAEIEQQKEALKIQTDNLSEMNEELSNRTEEIQQQADKLNSTNELLENINEKLGDRNKSITDSINYAKRIQDAMLPKPSYLDEVFKGASLFYQPKDIVGGDFYWILDRDDSIYWAVIDCTGHGVPGGFMSMIGNSILNEIVSEQGITEVDEILNTMRDKVIKSINGDVKNVHEAERKDGMDVALCKMDKDSGKLEFAGANLNAYIFHQGELVEIQGEPQPVGAYKSIIPFKKHSFATEFGDSVYIFTDGYPDQFGGIKHKKFKYRRMRKLLQDLQNKTMPEQEQMVAEVFKKWKGETHQTDDVSFLGIKL